MGFILKYVIPLVIAYLFGSVSFSIIVSYLLSRKDIRTMGSGNAGGTNVARNFGTLAGVAVILLDAAKCFAAVMLLKYAFNFRSMTLLVMAGVACVLGHMFPVFFKFKGGKGVASCAGLMLAVSPWSLLICFVVFVTAVALTRYVSLGSCLAAVAFPISIVFFGDGIYSILLSVFMAVMVIFMHRSNIKKLINHTESKLFEKKR